MTKKFKQEDQDGPGSLTMDNFFVAFIEEFTKISLSSNNASSPHSLMQCLLTDQNFANTF